MYESPRKYAAAVAHYFNYYLAVLGATPKKQLFQTIHLKLRPVLISNNSTKLASLAFIPETSKYFIEYFALNRLAGMLFNSEQMPIYVSVPLEPGIPIPIGMFLYELAKIPGHSNIKMTERLREAGTGSYG